MTKFKLDIDEAWLSSTWEFIKEELQQKETWFDSSMLISDEATHYLSKEQFERDILPKLYFKIGEEFYKKHGYEDHFGLRKRVGAHAFIFSSMQFKGLIRETFRLGYLKAFKNFGAQDFKEVIKQLEQGGQSD